MDTLTIKDARLRKRKESLVSHSGITLEVKLPHGRHFSDIIFPKPRFSVLGQCGPDGPSPLLQPETSLRPSFRPSVRPSVLHLDLSEVPGLQNNVQTQKARSKNSVRVRLCMIGKHCSFASVLLLIGGQASDTSFPAARIPYSPGKRTMGQN